MVYDNPKEIICDELRKNEFMFQREIKDMNGDVVCEVWRNRKGKDFCIYINELDLDYKVVIKEDEDKNGFIVDIELNNSIIDSEIYYYDDLEEEYREYLTNLANNQKADITKVLFWDDWIKQKKEMIKEATKEDIGDEL